MLVLLELAKVLAGFIMYLVACWGFKVCVHVFTLKSEKPAPAAFLNIALTQNHLIESDSPKKLLEALVNTYTEMKFASWSTLRHAYSYIKHRPEGRVKKEDQAKADAIFKILTAPKPPK